MPVFTTSNGRNRVFFVSHEINDALADYARSSGKSQSSIVREACIALLEKHGYSFSEFANPESKGQRTDLLRARDKEERDALDRELSARQKKHPTTRRKQK